MIESKERPAVSLKSVHKRYGTTDALIDINLSVEPGEVVALVGPSGSGKTTLLNTICGLTIPDSGEISISGQSLTNIKHRKTLATLVGIVSQQYGLIPTLPVVQNVLAGKLGSWTNLKSVLSLIWPQDRKQASSILSSLGLNEKINERTSHLSGGEQQRVAVARVLIQSPDVILADEPVASLDPALAESVMGLLSRITQVDNKTLILSSHSPYLIQTYCSRIIGIRQGRITFDMPISEINDDIFHDLYETNQILQR